MILEFDLGNSFVKWRLVNERFAVIDAGRFSVKNIVWEDQFDFILPVQQVWVSSVAGDEINQDLTEFCDRQWSIMPKFAKTMRRFLGVSNGYFYPEQLGVDRWLTIIAVFQNIKSACCVIDSGTAMTIDFINAGGVHLGGYIVPGLQLQQSMLLQSTREIVMNAVDESEAANENLNLGVNTHEAVVHGTELMMVSFIEEAIRQQSQLYHHEFQAVLTGGGAPQLKKHLTAATTWEPDLVFSGLEWVMRSSRQ